MAIVTISRKVGSLGDEIGARAAELLGYRLVGRQEIHALAQNCDDEFKKACSMFESELSTSFLERFFFKDPSSTSLFEALNYELAAEGNVVLLGRGGQIALAGVPGVFKARIVAPIKVRISRMMERDNISWNEAADYVVRYDKKRRALIESIFDQSLSDWSLYDLVINTASVPMEMAAELVTHAVTKMEPPDWPMMQLDLKNRAFAKRVESAITKKVVTGIQRGLEVTSKGSGAITLKGYVHSNESLDAAVKIAEAYPGVTSVDVQLKSTELRFN